jgi:predicted outer membrane repeat protein
MPRSLCLLLTALFACAPNPTDDTDQADTEPPDDSDPSTDTEPPDDSDPSTDSDPPDDTDPPPPPDADSDGSPDALDCDDADPTVYPGAPELCDDRLQDCDGAAPAPAGLASFFPTTGPGQDVTSALSGATAFTPASDGTLALCGGAWPAPLSVPTGRTLTVTAASRALLTGLHTVNGTLTLTGLDLQGTFASAGGSAAAPSATLTLHDVTVQSPANAPMFRGAMQLTVTDSDLVAAGELIDDLAALTLTDTTVQAQTVYAGNAPLLFGAPMTLDGVQATTSAGGFVASGGPVVVRDSQFTTTGPAEAMQLSASSLTLTHTRFVSDYDTAAPTPLLVLTDNIQPTVSDLRFEMAGQRGGVSTARGFTCERCTFIEPGRQPAIQPTLSGNVTIRQSTFTGLGGAALHDVQHFISFGTGGVLRLEDSTFTGGQHAAGGGAVHLTDGTLFSTRCTFTDNHSGASGGAVFAGTDTFSLDGLYLTDSTFTDNSAAQYGGAVDGANALQVSGSTFTDNSASLGGGALLARSSQSHSLTNTTFYRNDGGASAAVLYYAAGTNSLIVTTSNFGAEGGTDDNTPDDVRVFLPANGGQPGALVTNRGDGVTFTCFGSLSCN